MVWPADGQVGALEIVVHRGIGAGLHAEDLDGGIDRLGRDGDAGDQAAAADRHHQRVERLLGIGQHLERDGALAGDDARIVIGMDEGEAFVLRNSERAGVGFGERGAFQDDAGAEILGVLDLGEGRAFRHHDGDGNAQAAGMIGDALRMIAGRHGGDAALALVFAQRQQLVERAALLEGGGVLQVLEFEMDVGAGDARERVGMAGRRALDRALDGARGGADIVDRERGGGGQRVTSSKTVGSSGGI